ncbi:MAG TPA: 3-oxoacyl-ACP reductase FabG [Myxococcota bacterium]|nr:3-oxoacyl-ACP reductase FabG [Myxococcota bacterium]
MSARRVLVTGASRGIGRACALELARAGFDLALGFRSDAKSAEAVEKEVVSLGRAAVPLQFDVADRGGAAAAIGRDLAANGAYWGVVLAAGMHEDAAFPALSPEAWDRVVGANLGGFFNVLRPLVMPLIRMHEGGRIVAISSVAALAGNRGQVNYAAAKAGLHGATKSLALELAKRGITVNCIAPGLIETEMLAGAPVDELRKLVPMQRLGRPAEIASLVTYLFSEGAGYLTGQVISVNGGML